MKKDGQILALRAALVRIADGEIDAVRLARETLRDVPTPDQVRTTRRVRSVCAWLAKALHKASHNPRLAHIYSDGARLYATDTMRIHSAPIPDGWPAEPGYYDRDGQSVALTEEYYDMQKLINQGGTKVWIKTSEIPTITVDGTDLCMTGVPGGPVYVNLTYLRQAIQMEKIEQGGGITVIVSGPCAPVRVELSEGRIAVIAPFDPDRIRAPRFGLS